MNRRFDGPGTIKELQGGIAGEAQKIPIPSHFRTLHQGSRVNVTDTRTMRTVSVRLCDYQGFRRGLAFCGE